jgi:hypothetical protein
MDELRGIIPARWVLPERARTYDQQILVNWLKVEVPVDSGIAVKTETLCGWRNAEVYYFIRYEWPDWTARMYE